MNDFPRPYWSVFPLLLYRQLSTEAFDDLSDFIVKCGPDDWIKVFNSIELIGWFYSSAKDSLHLSFIKSLMKSIKAENIAPNQPRFGQFIYIVARFLFFRENNQCNTALLCQIQSEAPDFVELQSLVNFFKSNRKVSLHIDDNNFTVGDYFTLFIRGAEEQRKSCFGLRFDQNGVWLDKELAIACVRVIIKSRCAIGLMTVMIVCALLAKSNDDFIKEIVPQIDINPQKDGEKVLEVANFLFFKLFLVKKHNLFKYKPTGQSFGNEAIPFFCETCNIQSASPVTVAKEIKSLWLSSQAISEKLHNTLSDFSYQSRALFVEQAQIDYNKWCENNNKIWRHAWGYMTLEKAPWENAVPYHRHYMRDSTLCFAKCPFKLKPNWEFNDHVVASKARDEMKGSEKRMVLKRTESWAKSVSVLIKQQEPTKVLYSTKCTVVKVSHSTSASFDMHLHDFTITYSETHIHTYEYSSISAVSNQTHLHHQNSIEIFFTNDHSLFVVFEKTEERNQAVKIFQSKIKTFLQHALSELPGEKMNLWQKGKISNFEYLMYLNRLSGRTFLNPLQYPILPWILTDYTSSELNLNDPSIFRDLSKPVGALNEERLKAIEATEFDLGQTDGLYSNAMGCTLTLYIMMIRVEPFTTLHIQMQSGRFDVSDRIFTSIKQLYDTAMTNTNDVKELIPEFFFMPEMLLNLNNFDLGFTGKGNAGDVILPPWAKSAVEFVYLHRKALESDYVSQNINNWIDLIWGYKQRGSKAVEEKNNFSSMLYDDIWTPENLNDPKRKAQIEAAKTYLGQIPLQLFTSPHPQRDVEKEERVVLKSYRFKAPTSKLLFATIEQEKLQEIAVTFINEEGVLSKFYCKLSEGDDSSVSTSSVGSEPQVQILDTTDQQVTAFGLLPGNVILTFGRNINMYDANTGQLTPFGDSLQCWDIAGEWLAIVGVDSILKVYNAKNLKTPLCMTPFQRDLARCCCISPEFHVVVVASRDGGVVVHALETGFSIHSINLGVCMPQKVIVTPSWGFIVIYLTRIEENKLVHVLSVYTINGLFVREARVLSPISKMTCWKSPKGFDYIAISSERGSISTSEVFYLDFGKPMFRFQSSLVALKFNEKMGTLIAVSDDGKIFSEYYSYSNADKK